MASSSSTLSPGRAGALLGAVILVWGINWPFMKIGLESIGPMTFACARVALGTACLFAYAAATGGLRLPARQDWPVVFSVGLLHMVAFLSLVNLALLFVEAGRSAILAYTTPLWVVPAALIWLDERLSRLKAMGLVSGLLGVAALFNPVSFDWSDPNTLLGNGALMAAALAWAMALIHVRAHRWAARPLDLAPWQFLLATTCLIPIAAVTEGGREIAWSWELTGILVFNGPIATAFAFVAQVSIARSLPAITTSLGMLGVPVAGLLFSAAILGEPLTATKCIGLALIVVGLALVSLADRPSAMRRTG